MTRDGMTFRSKERMLEHTCVYYYDSKIKFYLQQCITCVLIKSTHRSILVYSIVIFRFIFGEFTRVMILLSIKSNINTAYTHCR